MPGFEWPRSARMAVSITFDDGRASQLDTAIPLLAEYEANATFYISPKNAGRRVEDWKAVAAAGHEIGNHTLTHPCSGSFSFSLHNGLEEYTLEGIAADIDGATTWMEENIGVTPRTFAYPCGLTFVGRGEQNRSYIPLVSKRFVAGRAYGIAASVDPLRVDLAHVWSHTFDRMEPEQVVAVLAEARSRHQWVVFTGHDVADHLQQAVSPETLHAILRWIRAAGHEVWLDTFAAVSTHIKEKLKSCSP